MTILTKLWEKVHCAKISKGQSDPNRSPLSVSPETRVSQHAEGLTLLHIPTGQVFVCNRTAARIWQGATEGRSADELSEEMSRQFHVERDRAQKDTYSMVSQMELYGLIVRSA
jgi:coenzyme PQQ synthesis protein D (PqqD)